MNEEERKTLLVALENNPECPRNSPNNFAPIYTTMGPSGEKELLVPIFLHKTRGYWYGYIQNSIHNSGYYYSMIIWLHEVVTGTTKESFLTSFHHIAWKKKLTEPATIQKVDDVFVESETFNSAVNELCRMIQRFEIDKRFPSPDSPYYDDPIDFHVLFELTKIKDLLLR